MDHSKQFLSVVEDAKSRIREITADAAFERIKAGATLVDVREDREWAQHAQGAVHVGRGVIERDIVGLFPENDAEIILYCGGGFRSALAADMLQKMGYTDVWSLAGGWKAWKEAGGATERESV